MMFESRIESIQMVETRRGREKIFEKSGSSRQRNTTVHCEGRVQEN
jgi:hypothetical protein